MSAQTQEQKDIEEIKSDIKSVRTHLANIKTRQDTEDSNRIEQNRKLDLIVNSLTDNDYNGKNGVITKINNLEKTVILHDLYWRIFAIVVVGGGILVGVLKWIFAK